MPGDAAPARAHPRQPEEIMLKALPFLWFLLAALGAAAQLFVARMSGGDAMGTMLFPRTEQEAEDMFRQCANLHKREMASLFFENTSGHQFQATFEDCQLINKVRNARKLGPDGISLAALRLIFNIFPEEF